MTESLATGVDNGRPPPPPPAAAGAWRRLLALAIDLFIVSLIDQALAWLLKGRMADDGAWAVVLRLGPGLAYFGLLNSRLSAGRTPGKRLLNLQVRGRDARPIGVPRAFLRAAVLATAVDPGTLSMAWQALQPPAPAAALLALNVGSALVFAYLLVFNRPARRSVHDLLVGTWVVNTAAAAAPPPVAQWRPHVPIAAALFAIGAAAAWRLADTDSNPAARSEVAACLGQMAGHAAVDTVAVFSGNAAAGGIGGAGNAEARLRLQVVLKEDRTESLDLARELANMFDATCGHLFPPNDRLRVVLLYRSKVGALVGGRYAGYTLQRDGAAQSGGTTGR